jgi:hypothetical protein
MKVHPAHKCRYVARSHRRRIDGQSFDRRFGRADAALLNIVTAAEIAVTASPPSAATPVSETGTAFVGGAPPTAAGKMRIAAKKAKVAPTPMAARTAAEAKWYQAIWISFERGGLRSPRRKSNTCRADSLRA